MLPNHQESTRFQAIMFALVENFIAGYQIDMIFRGNHNLYGMELAIPHLLSQKNTA
jgi:hypothetical protein